jgi:hypothetical protein
VALIGALAVAACDSADPTPDDGREAVTTSTSSTTSSAPTTSTAPASDPDVTPTPDLDETSPSSATDPESASFESTVVAAVRASGCDAFVASIMPRAADAQREGATAEHASGVDVRCGEFWVAVTYPAGCLLDGWSIGSCDFYDYAWSDDYFGFCINRTTGKAPQHPNADVITSFSRCGDVP